MTRPSRRTGRKEDTADAEHKPSGAEFVESLRDGRTVYVGGERVKDVTVHLPFRGLVATLASLYDLQYSFVGRRH